jgi:hypothetical protein
MSYCTKEEVNSLFGDISDDITDEMFATVIANSTAWIDSNLKKSYVPLPSITIEMVNDDGSTTVVESITTHTATYNLINVPNGLRTAAIYYAASDILLSLYHGDELPVQYDVWFNKAQGLLDDYIRSYLNSEAEEADLVKHQMVKHSHSLTYNQKRGRGRWRR